MVYGWCVHSLVDKYPRPADREMPGTAWTVVSMDSCIYPGVVTGSLEGSAHDPLQTSAEGYLGRL